jgi:hypothetical protein
VEALAIGWKRTRDMRGRAERDDAVLTLASVVQACELLSTLVHSGPGQSSTIITRLEIL